MPFRNSPGSGLTERPLVVVGNPENRRVRSFVEAAEGMGWRDIVEIPWLQVLTQEDTLGSRLREGAILRIDSSGENFEVERLLMLRGGAEAESESAHGFEFLAPWELEQLGFENGRVLPSRQWYLGWKSVLSQIDLAARQARVGATMNGAGGIAAMFDKAACHGILAEAQVRTPGLLGQPRDFDHLMDLMQRASLRRAFVKPCHSSSASGVIALEIGPSGLQAFTSLEQHGGRLFNSLRPHCHQTLAEIRNLVDAICRHRCIAEAWLPKAGFQGGRIDLRVLVVGGRVGHAVLRHSASPMTNLHLGNRRGDLKAFRGHLGEAGWERACQTSKQAARAFPDCLYVAVDLLISPSLRHCAVAEVNAFGDLLPGLLFEGMSTYQLELCRLVDFNFTRKVNS